MLDSELCKISKHFFHINNLHYRKKSVYNIYVYSKKLKNIIKIYFIQLFPCFFTSFYRRIKIKIKPNQACSQFKPSSFFITMSLNPHAKEWVPSWMKKEEPAPAAPAANPEPQTTTPATNTPPPPPEAKPSEAPVVPKTDDKEKPVSEDIPLPSEIHLPGVKDEENTQPEVEVIATPDDIRKEELEEPEISVKEEDLVEADPREHINVVFIGHVDAGKSTLSGNILYLTGQVDKRTIEKYEREAVDRARESWFLAFIMDTNEEERERGKTVEVGRAHFETSNRRFTILDAPGHKSYVPNMISGASEADVAVMVISARKGEFEAGFEKGGQTREHAMLAKTLGIRYIVLAINKMDEPTVKYSKDRYDPIVAKLTEHFKQLGYKPDSLTFLPISALKGDNIMTRFKPGICDWYKGPSLIEILDKIEIEGRDAKAPLRMPILDKYFDRGLCCVGKLEAGTIQIADKLMINPGKIPVEVTLIEVDEKAVKSARVGDNIELHVKGATEEVVHRGYVVCARNNPCPCCTKFEALLMVLEIPTLFSAGYEAVLHIHTAIVECIVVRLLETKDKKGQVVKHPVYVKSNSMVKVVIQINQSFPMETFSSLQPLGRFSLRDEGVTIGVGKVLKLIDDKNN